MLAITSPLNVCSEFAPPITFYFPFNVKHMITFLLREFTNKKKEWNCVIVAMSYLECNT